MYKNILSTALKGIAVAMGVAVIVLNILGALVPNTAANLLGIGLTALAINALILIWAGFPISPARRQPLQHRRMLPSGMVPGFR